MPTLRQRTEGKPKDFTVVSFGEKSRPFLRAFRRMFRIPQMARNDWERNARKLAEILDISSGNLDWTEEYAARITGLETF